MENIFLAIVSGGVSELCKSLASEREKFRVFSDQFFPFAVLSVLDAYNPGVVNLLKRGGFNWVIVVFENGWGRQVREVQKQGLNPFVNECHKHGIKTLAYVSLTNCFVQAQEKYFPEEWIQRDSRGDYIHYFDMPLRYLMCLRSGWLEEVISVCKEAVDFGFDGIYFDNVWNYCRCDRCWESDKRDIINESLHRLIQQTRTFRKNMVVVGNIKLERRAKRPTLTANLPVARELDWLTYEIDIDDLNQLLAENNETGKPVLAAITPYSMRQERILRLMKKLGNNVSIIVKLWDGETSFGIQLWNGNPEAFRILDEMREIRENLLATPLV